MAKVLEGEFFVKVCFDILTGPLDQLGFGGTFRISRMATSTGSEAGTFCFIRLREE